MNLSISNIGWSEENDTAVYRLMQRHGFTGLEIAPTRIFPVKPYEKIAAASEWKQQLTSEYGFNTPSMQSIWYGRTERLFGSEEDRQALLDYTKMAVDFAEKIGCGNLVFGCPRNRQIPDGADEDMAVSFFKAVGDYAAEHNTVIAMEANPPIYNTNFINTTASAIELIEKVNSPGFLLNLDLGTMIENAEDITALSGKEQLIHHVHISEPGLKPLAMRTIHKELRNFLAQCNYRRYISIEMGKTADLSLLEEKMIYVKGIFG